MWAIRILTGPQAGQVIPLKAGTIVVGRGSTCEVKLASTGVSKEHAQFLVTSDKVILSDMNSRNGTFVNGVRIQNQRLQPGDKLSVHDILIDLMQLPDNAIFPGAFQRPGGQALRPAGPAHGGMYGGVPVGMHNPMPSPYGLHVPPAHAGSMGDENEGAVAPRSSGVAGAYDGLVDYVETVAMPGVYHLARMLDYRWVIVSVVAIYICLVTAVAVIPTLTMVRSSIQEESQRRARTIARNLAAINSQPIVERSEISVTTRPAELEDGVTGALVVSAKDGSIIAPANQRGSYADKSFVARAKKSDKELVAQIDDTTIGASAPIMGYNSETRMNSVLAYAIVIYDMSSVVGKQNRTITLFIQILGIAGVLGLVLYFFLIRLIERPIEELNAQLDEALREGRDDLATEFQFPRLAALASNINSALSRITAVGSGEQAVMVNRDAEAMNLIRLMLVPALAINGIDDRIIVCNASFDRLVGGGVDLRGRPLTDIPDTALQQNLRDLVPRLRQMPDQVASGEIPFMGEPHEIRGQSVAGTGGEPAYYIITIRRAGQEEAG